MAASTSTPTLPGTKHKVIGLVSGGKDSCFNLMRTVANGHEVVALATLTPPAGTDELDSHMYQSVGTTLPPLIAQAMGLPHYSRVITGGAVEQGAEYGSREAGGGAGLEGDETEDLTALLMDVMAKHPEATAISSGAILSNYQRLRIEHVCQRLGLTSLAYLWQSEQLSLVESMISSGLVAVFVKVAGVGLTERCVGKTLNQLYGQLVQLRKMYGAHPAGEGGEYETLTLDTPLFSHRINIKKSEVVVTDPEPSLVAYLRIEDAELEAKVGWVKPTVQELRELLQLDQDDKGQEGLDEESRDMFDELRYQGANIVPSEDVSVEHIPIAAAPKPVQFGKNGRWFSLSVQGEQGDSVGDELKCSLDAAKARLASEGLSLSLHATHITLLLSSMADFPAANAAYVQYFGTSPPSRACVAVPLPAGERVRVDIVGFDDTPSGAARVGDRSALHVQGISYWAPANIGPYSQAVTVNARLHIAGQIPLQPASLTIAVPTPPDSPYAHQATLALQHVRRIVQVLQSTNSTGGGWTGWGESCVAWWARPSENGPEGPAVVQNAWRLWAKQRPSSALFHSTNWHGAPVIFVRAAELPRGALVEYQVNLHTGREGYEPTPTNDDDEDEDEIPQPSYASGELAGAYWETCRAPASRQGARAAIFLPHTDGVPSLAAETDVAAVLSRAAGAKVYHLPSVDPSNEPLVKLLEGQGVAWTAVPVLDVQDINGRAYVAALEVFAA